MVWCRCYVGNFGKCDWWEVVGKDLVFILISEYCGKWILVLIVIYFVLFFVFWVNKFLCIIY